MLNKFLNGLAIYKKEAKVKKSDVMHLIFDEAALRSAASNTSVRPSARIGLMDYLFDLDGAETKHADVVKQLVNVLG